MFFIFITLIFLSIEVFLIVKNRVSIESSRKFQECDAEISFVNSINRLIDTERSETMWEIKWIKYRANASFTRTINNQKCSIRTNSHGFRTREFSVLKNKDTIRILCIGASTTAEGYTNETTYPAELERILNAEVTHVQFEVLNLGISGTYSDYWVERWNTLQKYDPDIIIQYNAVNDICWRYVKQFINEERNKWRRLLIRSHLFHKSFPIKGEDFDEYLIKTLGNFKTIASAAESNGIHYLTASFAAPDYESIDQNFRHYLDDIVQNNWGSNVLKFYTDYYTIINRFNFLFKKFVTSNDIDHLLVHEKIRNPELFIDLCHMKYDGSRIKASLFAEHIQKKSILNSLSNKIY